MLVGLVNPHQYSLPGSYRLKAPITLATHMQRHGSVALPQFTLAPNEGLILKI